MKIFITPIHLYRQKYVYFGIKFDIINLIIYNNSSFERIMGSDRLNTRYTIHTRQLWASIKLFIFHTVNKMLF